MSFCVKLSCNGDIVVDDVFSGSFSDCVLSYDDGVLNIFYMNTFLLKRVYDDYCLVFDFSNRVCRYVGSTCFNFDLELLDFRVVVGDIFLKYRIVDSGYIYEYSVKW